MRLDDARPTDPAPATAPGGGAPRPYRWHRTHRTHRSHRSYRSSWRAASTLLVAVLVACSSESEPAGPVVQPSGPAITAADCVVRLHGKSESGAAASVDAAGIARIAPNGNERDGQGYRWMYFPEASYVAARDIVVDAIDRVGCERVVLGGFSNGAAFAAKLWCSGDDLGAPVVGVVIDDPVPDQGASGCAPVAPAPVTLFWTGALEATAQPGWDCDEGGWICEGGTTIGIEQFALDLGTEVTPSPFTEHLANVDAPEWTAFP